MQSQPLHKLKILVAPLDWGLGHTTRCIPIVYELLKCGAEVLLAGNAVQQALLSREFPACTFINLEGYNISYSSTVKGFVWGILRQTPAMLQTIRRQNTWRDGIIDKHQIDAVISDNRYGLHSKKVPCVFITHQLYIKNGLGKLGEQILQRFNYKQINNFTKCWIPDFKGTPNLAGELSHPKIKPATTCEYIDPLSRIKFFDHTKTPGYILFILSGPEPQRSIFETIIFEQLQQTGVAATVVRGKPADINPPAQLKGVTVYNHLSTDDLNKEMCRADYIICRSGYSSVMDIARLNTKPILVPTPGQTEQEYLASYLSKLKFCITSSQKDFNIQELLGKATAYQFHNPFLQKKYNLGEVVQSFVNDCLAMKKMIRP